MNNLLQAPPNAGRLIVESTAVLACPLLDTEKFVRFCRDRDLDIDRTRLLRLERLGLFAPIFRVRAPTEKGQSFHIPVRGGNNWFEKGWAWDTTRIPFEHEVPSDRSSAQQGYYSIFQIDWLRLVLNEMTLHVQMDAYLADPAAKASRSDQGISRWVERFREVQESSSAHTYRPSIALLCQYISNRYYPQAIGDQRTIRTGSSTYWDRWLSVGDRSWTWESYVRSWDPEAVATHFGLTPERLKHAYRTLSGSQWSVDPIANWYPLVQFVSLDKRRKLKGTALQAETLREGALMLRGLYFDLYHEKLPPPDEIYTTVVVPMPEREVRKDARMHLEYITNQYGLNPQPKLVLFVEGQSEERVVHRLLEEYFGILPGRLSIEIVTVRGVDNATGTSEDRFRAILRLVDYLHHHQTFAFVVLDNENYASKLKRESATTPSTYGHRRRITRPEYVHVWKSAFELDNFSSSELAQALTRVSGDRYRFAVAEIAACRTAKNPGAALSKLYREATQFGLPKLQLADALVDILLSDQSRKRAENRPIVKVLVRALKLAALNHLPTRQEAWAMNQASKLLARKT